MSRDGLPIGVFCAFLYWDWNEVERRVSSRWPIWLIAISSISLILLLFTGELLSEFRWYEKILQPLVISLTFGGMLLSVLFGGSKGQILRSHFFLVIARISYPLYLIHFAFVPLALTLTGYNVGDDFFAFLGYLAVFVGVSTFAALLLHFSVEKPFLILKDSLRKAPDLPMAARQNQIVG